MDRPLSTVISTWLPARTTSRMSEPFGIGITRTLPTFSNHHATRLRVALENFGDPKGPRTRSLSSQLTYAGEEILKVPLYRGRGISYVRNFINSRDDSAIIELIHDSSFLDLPIRKCKLQLIPIAIYNYRLPVSASYLMTQ